MKLWLVGDQRWCDRATAIELGGSEYRDTSIHTIYHFDEFIKISEEAPPEPPHFDYDEYFVDQSVSP